MQGEYVIPSVAAIPKSAAEMALMQGAGGQSAAPGTSPFEQADGRWRVQVLARCTQTYRSMLHLPCKEALFGRISILMLLWASTHIPQIIILGGSPLGHLYRAELKLSGSVWS